MLKNSSIAKVIFKFVKDSGTTDLTRIEMALTVLDGKRDVGSIRKAKVILVGHDVPLETIWSVFCRVKPFMTSMQIICMLLQDEILDFTEKEIQRVLDSLPDEREITFDIEEECAKLQ